MYLSSGDRVWQLDSIPHPGEQYESCDRLYIPRISSTTGDLDIREMAVAELPENWENNSELFLFKEENQKLIFVNTLYSCLAAFSQR